MPTVAATDNATRWFVYTVSYKKELEIVDSLHAAGIEAYVPLHFQLHTVGNRKVRRQEPAIYGLVFARGNRQQLLDFRDECAHRAYMFLRSQRLTDGTLRYICVDDDEMDNFRRLNDIEGAKLTYYKPEELRLARGEKVRIMDGPFEGIVGTVERLPHRRGQYLVVALPDIAVAAVNIRPEYLQPLTKKVAKSDNVERDSRRLAKLALAILNGDDERQEVLMRDEMTQLEQALEGCKTFLPNDRANYFFAFYASALATGRPADTFRQQLTAVMPRLKGNNLLLPLANLLIYKDTNDATARANAEATIEKWDRTRYTQPQKEVVRCWQKIVRS